MGNLDDGLGFFSYCAEVGNLQVSIRFLCH